MSDQLLQILPFISLAALAGIVGGVLALIWSPGVHARSAVQHFAAGVVGGAVASELIPEAEKFGTAAGVLGGFAAGGLAMIGLKWLVLKFEKQQEGRQRLPFGLTVAAAVDTFIDGAIMSAGFSSGRELGTLLTIALAVELFFLNLSVGSEFHKHKKKSWQGLLATIGVALMLLIGAVLAFFILHGVSQSTLAICLAFGAAALLYLIAEELLVESPQAEENLFSTAMLFVGFMVILAAKFLSAGAHS